jgi:hypothetical protein
MELREEQQQSDEHLGLLGSGSTQPLDGGAASDDRSGREGTRRAIHLIAPERVDPLPEPAAPTPAPVVISAPSPSPSPKTSRPSAARGWSPPRRNFGAVMRWATVAVSVVAVGEAVVIARLLSGRSTLPPVADAAVMIESPQPGSRVLVDDEPAGVTPLQLSVGPRVRSIRVLPVAVTGQLEPVTAPATEPKQSAPSDRPQGSVGDAVASQRTGGFRLSSPIELHVLDGERVLGSSEDGPIVATAGRHEFEFVNSAIGYRVRRVVNIRAGQIASVSITPPNGIVNINAVPWAAVWIDGNAVGETPVGNLSVAPGEHEIVFRHPQLGERRERTVVRTDGPTRVTANLQRPN